MLTATNSGCLGAESPLPYAEIARRVVENKTAKILDDAGRLGHRHEALRTQEAEGPVPPPHQRFEARQIHVGETGDRLINNLDLVPLEGAAQFRFKRHEFAAVVAHRGAEEFNRILAAPLGFIKGDRRILEKILRRLALLAIAGDAKAGGEENLLRPHADRPRNRLADRIGEGNDIAAGLAAREQDRELIAGKARHRIVLARHRGEASAGDVEQAIAGLVAEAIIDSGEAIEIDQYQVDVARVSLFNRGDGAVEPIGKERPVGQSGDAIIDRIIEKLLLGTPRSRSRRSRCRCSATAGGRSPASRGRATGTSDRFRRRGANGIRG